LTCRSSGSERRVNGRRPVEVVSRDRDLPLGGHSGTLAQASAWRNLLLRPVRFGQTFEQNAQELSSVPECPRRDQAHDEEQLNEAGEEEGEEHPIAKPVDVVVMSRRTYEEEGKK